MTRPSVSYIVPARLFCHNGHLQWRRNTDVQRPRTIKLRRTFENTVIDTVETDTTLNMIDYGLTDPVNFNISSRGTLYLSREVRKAIIQ